MAPSPRVPASLALALVGGLCVLAGAARAGVVRYPHERLGLRAGFVGTSGGLHDSYGHGSHVNLYFAERVSSPWYLQIRVGSFALGDLRKPELARRFGGAGFVGPAVASDMRIQFLTGGPQYTLLVGERGTAYASLEAGVYSVSVTLDDGLLAVTVSDSHFGANAGVGYMVRVHDGWNLDANATLHFVGTGTDLGLFTFFTEGDNDPLLLQLSLGVTIDLR